MAVSAPESKTVKSVTSKKGTITATPSEGEPLEPMVKTFSPFEAAVVETFKKEFRGMPYTDITVVARCGAPSSPTYQEIELMEVSSLLKKFRG